MNRCETLGFSEIIQGFDSLIPYSYDFLSYARGVITWIIRDVCHQLPMCKDAGHQGPVLHIGNSWRTSISASISDHAPDVSAIPRML